MVDRKQQQDHPEGNDMERTWLGLSVKIQGEMGAFSPRSTQWGMDQS